MFRSESPVIAWITRTSFSSDLHQPRGEFATGGAHRRVSNYPQETNSAPALYVEVRLNKYDSLQINREAGINPLLRIIYSEPLPLSLSVSRDPGTQAARIQVLKPSLGSITNWSSSQKPIIKTRNISSFIVPSTVHRHVHVPIPRLIHTAGTRAGDSLRKRTAKPCTQ